MNESFGGDPWVYCRKKRLKGKEGRMKGKLQGRSKKAGERENKPWRRRLKTKILELNKRDERQ